MHNTYPQHLSIEPLRPDAKLTLELGFIVIFYYNTHARACHVLPAHDVTHPHLGLGELSLSHSDKRRSVSVATVEKWRSNNDKELSTLTWLVYDKIDRYHVSHLRCSICTRFQDKIESSRNFSRAFITGKSNLCTSAFRDHAKSDMPPCIC